MIQFAQSYLKNPSGRGIPYVTTYSKDPTPLSSVTETLDKIIADLEEAKKVASRLEAGTVWINQHGAIHPMVPFGGAKNSGYGGEFGIEGLKAVTQPFVISIKK